MGYVYGLRLNDSPEIRYVGLTIQAVDRRLVQHRSATYRGSQLPVHNWMRKYGEKNVAVEVLEEHASHEDLCEAERRWIAHLRAGGAELLNLLAGGDGFIEYTEARRASVGQRRRGAKMSAETRKRMSESHTGKVKSPEHRARIAESNRATRFRKYAELHGDEAAQRWFEKRESEDAARAARRASRQAAAAAPKQPRRTYAGEENPNYGKRHSPETLAKISASSLERRGVGLHQRWHVNRSIVKPGCPHCEAFDGARV